ncbi:MAG: hypothetical protein LBN42_00300 [Oscillospiraceae bacterium]|jgi:flagellar operon protein|nr:hypothetical protein [Oscillospiraceae bacterium]
MTIGELQLQAGRLEQFGNSKKIQSVKSEIPQGSGETFAEILSKKSKELSFSAHALRRLESRNIGVDNDTLGRLTKGVDIAENKGASEALVLVDNTAFVVSIRNHKVITAMSGGDLKENVFTNIDSTVIM